MGTRARHYRKIGCAVAAEVRNREALHVRAGRNDRVGHEEGPRLSGGACGRNAEQTDRCEEGRAAAELHEDLAHASSMDAVHCYARRMRLRRGELASLDEFHAVAVKKVHI